MSIDVSASIEIARPRDVVAAFVEDPGNDLRWIRALQSVEPLPGVASGLGLRVRRVAKMMGRPIDYTTEVVGFESAARLVMRTIDGPFPMTVTYAFEDGATGTLVTVRNQGGSGMLFALFGPLIGRMVNGRVRGDLVALKRAIEAVPQS